MGLAVPLAGAAGVLAVFLSPTLSAAAGILPDMWMQNRYYRNYGVVAGFVTNVQNLKVDKPEGYGKEAVTELARQARLPVSYTHLDVYKRQNLDGAALTALRHIALVEDKKIFSFSIPPESMEALGRAAEHYAAHHLDKPLKTLDFLKTVLL